MHSKRWEDPISGFIEYIVGPSSSRTGIDFQDIETRLITMVSKSFPPILDRKDVELFEQRNGYIAGFYFIAIVPSVHRFWVWMNCSWLITRYPWKDTESCNKPKHEMLAEICISPYWNKLVRVENTVLRPKKSPNLSFLVSDKREKISWSLGQLYWII